MANKTNPIGVRFRQDILENLRVAFKIESPQKALVFLENFYVTNSRLAKDVTQVLREEPANIDRDALEKELSSLREELSKIPDTGLGKRLRAVTQSKIYKIETQLR